MTASSLPSFAIVIVVVVIVANLATAWLVLLTIGENNGNLFSEGPPLVAALSCVSLGLCYYNIILSREVSFWGSAGLGALGLWGAWVDYTRLCDHRKARVKSRNAHKAAS